ncbi:hypothetical protein [Cryptosporangium aurantiacum]|uniref:Uncharacterized protein n=1 Tax=Cryptosporangium aurantiacum TaxID=134849 RepID=A0A1M7RPN5_9ACTN|nr:hypothetical protein [Cryptosporangium aurantiacum]SHN48189.1 hypothetical protein SAMN05443668_1367 [Cryptosporangium aurantiacum]
MTATTTALRTLFTAARRCNTAPEPFCLGGPLYGDAMRAYKRAPRGLRALVWATASVAGALDYRRGAPPLRGLAHLNVAGAAWPAVHPYRARATLTHGWAALHDWGHIRAEVINDGETLFALTTDWEAVRDLLPELAANYDMPPLTPDLIGPDSVRHVRVEADPDAPEDVERWHITCNATAGGPIRPLTDIDDRTFRAVYVDLGSATFAALFTEFARDPSARAAMPRATCTDDEISCVRRVLAELTEASATEDDPRLRVALAHLEAAHPGAWFALGGALVERGEV